MVSEIEKLVEEMTTPALLAFHRDGLVAAIKAVIPLAYAAGRKAGREEAASAMDAKAAQLRKYASEDRSRNNPAGGIWNDTRAVEVRNYAAAIRALPEG